MLSSVYRFQLNVKVKPATGKTVCVSQKTTKIIFNRSRYVRTPAYVEEVEQGRGVQYRGFGTNKPGGWLANVFDIRDKVRVIMQDHRLAVLAQHGSTIRP